MTEKSKSPAATGPCLKTCPNFQLDFIPPSIHRQDYADKFSAAIRVFADHQIARLS